MMVKSILKIFIFVSCIFMLVRPAWSQNTGDVEKDRQIKGLVMVGLNLTQVDGDEVYGYYKAGLNAGVGASLPLGKGFAFNVETIFNQKGAYKKYTIAGDSSGLPYYHLKLDYVEIPVTFSYEDKHIWTLGLGFSYGRRVSYREVERGIPQDSGSRYGKNDFCVLVDLQFRVWKHLKFDMRYQYSMAKIRTRNFGPTLSGDTWTRDQYNNMLTFRALYVLNEKYTPVHKKKTNRKKTTAFVALWTS